jgi:Tfp pilus assembly protein PilZ
MASTRHRRYELTLKIEYESRADLQADFLSDLRDGGLALHSKLHMAVGQKLELVLSLPGLPTPLRCSGVVRWSRPTDEPGSSDVGIEFIDIASEHRIQFDGLRRAVSNPGSRGNNEVTARAPLKILLLETSTALQSIYSREVRNWFELIGRQDGVLSVVASSSEYAKECALPPVTLCVIDLDALDTEAVESILIATRELPLVVLSTELADIESPGGARWIRLRKPLKFGVLMKTLATVTDLGLGRPLWY